MLSQIEIRIPSIETLYTTFHYTGTLNPLFGLLWVQTKTNGQDVTGESSSQFQAAVDQGSVQPLNENTKD